MRAFRSENFRDVAFLVAFMALSAVPYIFGLGFYSDDWTFIEAMGFSPGRSPLDFFRALYVEPVHMRPVQIAQIAILYWLFGDDPLGYHVWNLALLCTMVVFLDLVLREIGVARFIRLAIALLYGLLPHYSTDRFWIAAFQANLSMLLFLASAWCQLRAARAPSSRGTWHLASAICMIASLLAYEVVLPLFALTPLLVLYVAGRRDANRARAFFASSAVTLAALIPTVALKLAVATRTRALPFEEHFVWLATLLRDATVTSFVDFGLRLPLVLGSVLRTASAPAGATLGIITVLASFFWLTRAARQADATVPTARDWILVASAGAAIFYLGYAVFTMNVNAQVSAAGISNRIAIASAIGVSLCFVAVAGLLSRIPRNETWRRRTFCALVSLLAGANCVIVNGIAQHWVEAYRKQLRVLDIVRQQLPALEPGTTLILDGFCPYDGPAIVFDAAWDITSALRVAYGTREIFANVVTPNLHAEEEAMVAALYSGGLRDYHPYERLFIHNIALDLTVRIPDATAALAYFARYNADRTGNCPAGTEGIGVPIF